MPYADPEKRKIYHREYYRAYYHRNKEVYAKSREKSKLINRVMIAEFKSSKGCEACGYNANPAALDLHHPNGDKFMAVSEMARKCHKNESVLEEMKKCIVLCANCHRILHHDLRVRKIQSKGV